SMMRTAERDETVGIVPAAVGAPVEVMHVEESRLPAARHRTATAISVDDCALVPRRHRLLRAARRWNIDAAELLRVAFGAIDRDLVDDHLFTCRLLRRHSAAVTGGQSDLIAAQPFIATAGAAEQRPRHRLDRS